MAKEFKTDIKLHKLTDDEIHENAIANLFRACKSILPFAEAYFVKPEQYRNLTETKIARFIMFAAMSTLMPTEFNLINDEYNWRHDWLSNESIYHMLYEWDEFQALVDKVHQS